MTGRWAGILAAAMLLAPIAAAAVEPPTASFQIGAEQISWTDPEGYCLPTGTDAAVFQAIAAVDDRNVTDLSLSGCADGKVDPYRYLIVKTPKRTILATFNRQTLLTDLRPIYDKVDVKDLMPKDLDKDVSRKFAEIFGADIAVKPDIKPMSVDELCAYVGGSSTYSSGELAVTIAVAACTTTVRGKVVTISAYDRFQDMATIAKLMRHARALATDMIAQNEKVAP